MKLTSLITTGYVQLFLNFFKLSVSFLPEKYNLFKVSKCRANEEHVLNTGSGVDIS